MLLGKADASGRLPFTWYRSLDQLPPIGDYGIRPAAGTRGRTYMYFTGDVTYPFGYGLGYGRVSYAHLRADRRTADANGALHLTADVTNPGATAATAVPQLYAGTPDAPAAAQRPIRRLMAFDKITVPPHRTRQVRFTVPASKLAFFDQTANRYKADPGTYEFQLGPSSGDITTRAAVRITGTLRATPAVVTAQPTQPGDPARGVAQRVMFTRGTTVNPQLTVSMRDETRYGYITKGASVPLPKHLTVTYHSDHPRVARIHGGTITTTGPGVATITATVRYNDHTATTSFVVHVS